MNINRNNYEEAFIDYFDGKLSAERVADLFLFLESNPELKNEFENFHAVTLESSQIEFPFKNELKRGVVNDENVSQYMIAFVEGDLTADEQSSLDSYLKLNPSRENDLKIFKSTKLIPGNEIFPGKRELKKIVPFAFNFNNTISYAIAAMLILSLIGGTYYLFTRNTEKTAVEFAESPKQVNEKNNQQQNSSSTEIDSANNKKPASVPTNTPSLKNEDFQLAHQNKVAPPARNHNSNPNKKESFPNDKLVIEPTPVATIDPIILNELPVTKEIQQVKTDNPVALNRKSLPVKEEKYLTVIEALLQASDRTLQKVTSGDDNALALADESTSPRTRVSDLLERGIEKVSNDKVAITSDNTTDSDRSRFSFSIGKFKIEKDIAK